MKTFESFNPATGEVVGVFPVTTAREVNDAVSRANIAAQRWSELSFRKRLIVLRDWASLLTREIENAADCTPVLVSDTVQLIGPEAPVQVQPFVPGYGEVGSYTLERYRTIELITGTGNVYINTTFPWNGGTWKVMGTYFTTRSSDGNESTEDDLVLIMRIA